jgi:hypothetical protein
VSRDPLLHLSRAGEHDRLRSRVAQALVPDVLAAGRHTEGRAQLAVIGGDRISMKKKTAESLGKFVGAIAMYGVSLLICLGMVRIFDITWDRALLFEVLWLASLTRWHQVPEKKEGDE